MSISKEGKFIPETRDLNNESLEKKLLRRVKIVRELRQMLDEFPDSLSKREIEEILEDKLKIIREKLKEVFGKKEY